MHGLIVNLTGLMLSGEVAKHTGSERGKLILAKWEEYLPKFVKVMPVEYRKVLENLAKR